MSFISYAQNLEDVLLWRALGEVAAGRYIDVGANDPHLHSVTKAFYERGWSGINVEPMPSYRAAFLEQRPRDINLNVAAGAACGEITLFDVPDVNGWASTDAAVAGAHRAQGHAVLEHTVPLLTLAEICRRHVSGPVHFLKIDVEGFEGEVLRGMDFALCRPWIVVVEAVMPNSRDSNHAGWEALLTGQGYGYAWFDGLNRYYVAAEHAALAARLQLQPNVFDDYLPGALDEAWRRTAVLSEQAELAWAQARQAAAHHAELEQALQRAGAQTRQALDDVLRLQGELQHNETRLHQSAAWGQGLERQLLAVYASSSWRLTAPLRFLLRRGEASPWKLGRRRARGAVRRAARWLSSRQALRRALLPLLLRHPALAAAVTRLLARLKHGGGAAAAAADVPPALRELPLSARQVLADLRRPQPPQPD